MRRMSDSITDQDAIHLTYQKETMYGCVFRRLEKYSQISLERSLTWTRDNYITSHLNYYVFVIQQEITTK